jgi:hypothetical protein
MGKKTRRRRHCRNSAPPPLRLTSCCLVIHKPKASRDIVSPSSEWICLVCRSEKTS